MPRTTKTITFSLPPDMAEQVEKTMKAEGRTRSELLREALRRYFRQRQEWQRLLEYGQRRAGELGIRPEDVDRLVHEDRAEQARRARGA
jgi:Arc/MetJ-type ribon-helix-helix transcriptional regulator